MNITSAGSTAHPLAPFTAIDEVKIPQQHETSKPARSAIWVSGALHMPLPVPRHLDRVHDLFRPRLDVQIPLVFQLLPLPVVLSGADTGVGHG